MPFLAKKDLMRERCKPPPIRHRERLQGAWRSHNFREKYEIAASLRSPACRQAGRNDGKLSFATGSMRIIDKPNVL